MQSEDVAINADAVWGVDEIAIVVGRTRRVTQWLLQNGELPGRKVGGRWVASRRRLRAFLAGDEA